MALSGSTIQAAVRTRLVEPLRGAPGTVFALVAVAVFLVWAPTEGGYPLSTWSPGTLLLIGLLAVGALGAAPRLREVAVEVRVAAACLGLFTAWSFASIVWADASGEAWDGANRTLLYLVVFCLFALWRQRGGTAATLVGAWAVGLTAIATVVTLRIRAADDPSAWFLDDRLFEPAGYANAAAALWLMAVWPCLVLAVAPRVPWPVRGALAFGAGLLIDLALLSQSRGALVATPIVLAGFLLVVPGRLRHLAVLGPVAGAVALAVPGLLDVGPALVARSGPGDAVADALGRALATAAAAGVLVAAVGALLAWRPPSPRTALAARRAGAALALVALLAGGALGLQATGNPIERVEEGWQSFKGGYAERPADSSRLVGSGLGSNRYDFYRVAVDLFAERPLGGVGADNFQQDYLVRGRSTETPRYPHSLELRTLAQTGVVGTALLVGFLLAAALGALRAMRSADHLARAAAGAGLMVFGYWAVHGSADWFWEYAGLGAPAFAFLGLACALAPAARQPASTPAEPRREERRGGRLAVRVAGVALTVAGVLSVASPWLAERDVVRAGAQWPADPDSAYERLDRAAALNPLSDRPQLVAATISLRRGNFEQADQEFAAALERVPRGAYAALERGAIASAAGQRDEARRLLARAVALNPRDDLSREALRAVRRGRRIDVAALNDQILARTQALVAKTPR